MIMRSYGRKNANSSAVWIAETGLEKRGIDGLRKIRKKSKIHDFDPS